MSDPVKAFFDAWVEADPAKRLKAVESSMPDGAVYVDPRTPAPLSTASAISDYAGMFVEMAPGAVAEIVDTQTQHDRTRATIAFRMKDGMEQLGQYFIERNDKGAITQMVGFVGTGAPA